MFHGAETEPPVPSPYCRHKYLLPTEHRAPVPQIEAKVLAPSTARSDTQSHLQRIKQRPVSALLDPRPSPPVGGSCADGGMMSGDRLASPTKPRFCAGSPLTVSAPTSSSSQGAARRQSQPPILVRHPRRTRRTQSGGSSEDVRSGVLAQGSKTQGPDTWCASTDGLAVDTGDRHYAGH